MILARVRTTIPDRHLLAHRPDRKPLGLARDLCRALLGAMFILAVQQAGALSLGEAQTASHIGDVLQIRIPLTATADEGVTSECIRLEGPRAETGEDFPWLRAGRLRLTQSGGQQQLLISSLQSVQSPVIMLAVRVDCGSTLRREYTLLLNPAPASDAAPASAPPVAPANTPLSSGAANIWRTASGESLRTIARSLLPADRGLQARYVALLRQRNAAVLRGIGDSAPLPPGTELTVPAVGELNAGPTGIERSTPIIKRPAPPPAKNEETFRTPSRRSALDLPRQRLIVSGDDRAGLQLATGLSGRKELSEPEREKLRTELQLIATLDDKIATQLELSEKLRQLEALQVQLQSDVHSLEERIRTQQATLQSNSANPATQQAPAQPPPGTQNRAALPAPATPDQVFEWHRWILPAAGVVALLVVLLGWRYYRSSGSYTLETTDTQPDAEEGQTPPPADDLFEPLSEEDIWPDAASLKRPSAANTGIDLPLSDLGPASVLHIDEEVEEHNSAVELAEIMMSFGRVQGAAQTLADFIRANPKQAVKPWVKLLEVYKTANMRPEFEALTSQLNKTFNVKPVTWDDFDVALRAPESLEHIEHIATRICDIWGKRECQTYLHSLLRDNRQGTRQGFPLAIVDEILLLLAILESQLGPYKPDIEPAQQPVPEQTSRTMTTPAPFATPPSPPTEPTMTTSWRPKNREERSALNFDLGKTDFDLGIDTDDLTRTLHINLDDLPDEPTRTNVNPRKQEDD